MIGTGAVGALAYTFSDTFWFSAVEAEVYGMSSFFTAIVVWAAFKWERIEDEAAANRWLIFIAYLTGLSIGVHLLNLVTLPALALIYYFKKYPKPTFWGGAMAFGIGLVILGIINAGIIPGLPGMAFAVERFFVNTLGLTVHLGCYFLYGCLYRCHCLRHHLVGPAETGCSEYVPAGAGICADWLCLVHAGAGTGRF